MQDLYFAYFHDLWCRLLRLTALREAEDRAFALFLKSIYDLRDAFRAREEEKAGYRPNQPRVPRGHPDGGQWTRGGAIAGNDEVHHVVSIPDASGSVPRVVNIFVGGLDDNDKAIVKNSNSLNKDTYGDNYYAEWDSTDKIIAFIKTLPETRSINLIGHSWGGDTAVKVAIRSSHRINNLITVDPVSDRNKRASYQDIAKSVRFWINVNATGNPSSSIFEGLLQGNFAAGIGDAWDNTPEKEADLHIKAPYNHSNFAAMMLYGNVSPQFLLNKR